MLQIKKPDLPQMMERGSVIIRINYYLSYYLNFFIVVPPMWVKEPENSEVVLNQDIMIDCKATGDPEPYNVWKKDIG